jgi:hypothetical protein
MNMEGRESSVPMTTTQIPSIGLFIELGRQVRKDIRQLKQGDSALTWQIEAAVTALRESLGIEADVEVVPVVLLYHLAEPDYVVVGGT